jgi:threonine dehydrogenase-like Zn-dependent dehydrogenase
MKAVRWYGKGDIRVEQAPDPRIQDPRDAIVRITATAICGSDLHIFNGFTIKTGKTHVPRYHASLLERIVRGEIDPWFVITHRGSLEDAPALYKKFRDREDGCIKVVLHP